MKYNNNQIDFENDDRFNILTVAYSLGLRNLIPENYRYTTECPFCGAKSGHFYLTTEDPRSNYKNVYRCVKCGQSGSSTKLYYELTHCTSMAQAVKELAGIEVKSKLKKIIKNSKEGVYKNKKNLNELTDINTRNQVYQLLIKNLKISTKHYDDLINRGLAKVDIIKNGYRTLPKEHFIKTKICREILNSGLSLKGVPGFYTTYNGSWTFWTPKEGGFLVPVKDYLGRIQGCQIRKDSPETRLVIQAIEKAEKTGAIDDINYAGELVTALGNDKQKDKLNNRLDTIAQAQGKTRKGKKSFKKYPWFSSGCMDSGTYSEGFIHVHWNSTHSAEKVVITEGPLKGSIASTLSDTTFVAVPGTKAFKGIIEVLNNIGARNLYLAYDMDKYKNVFVMQDQFKLITYLKENKYKNIKISDWNKQFKGIDDYLFHIKRKALI